jgi:hypothetical protein
MSVSYSSERCLQLAEQAHLTYTANLIAAGRNRDVIEVPSRDRTAVHTVLHVKHDVLHENRPEGSLYCDCQATSPNCCHIGAALKLLDQRAQAYAAARWQHAS